MVFLFKKRFIFLLNLLTFLGCLLLVTIPLKAQTTKTIKAGSFIIDMGVVPQTVGNGLKPYGLIYDLIINYHVPILWSIKNDKLKDAADFTIGATDYKGGPFIIEAEYRSNAVNADIVYWQNLGVVGVTTTSPLTVPVGTTLIKAPTWTLDKKYGNYAMIFFTNAGIPSSAYGGSDSEHWKKASDLTSCDEIYVIPHADPTWENYGNLLDWNLNSKGNIWLGCSAVSNLEDLFNNSDKSKQTNFLTEKTITASGEGPFYENALKFSNNHDAGVPPYTYEATLQSDPIMQFMDVLDNAVTNGSETIYIPLDAGWRASTKIGIYQSNHSNTIDNAVKHRAAVVAWGNGFGDANRGKILIEASHKLYTGDDTYKGDGGGDLVPYRGGDGGGDVGGDGKGDGKGGIKNDNSLLNSQIISFDSKDNTKDKSKDYKVSTAQIAAQRVFFNFSFTATTGTDVKPTITGLSNDLQVLYTGQSIPLSVTVPSGSDINTYSVKWTSNNGGTFSSQSAASTSFTAPGLAGMTKLSVSITDNGCKKNYFDSKTVDVQCQMQATPTVADACNSTPNGGAINISVTNGVGPYVWKYLKSGATDSVSGTGTNITSLSPGSYGVTVTGSSGLGCVATFTTSLNLLNAFSVAKNTITNVSKNGGSDGTATITVTGSNPTYTYKWSNKTTTQNLTSIAAGSYSVSVTDSKGCIATLENPILITEPLPITVTPTVTNVNCFGNATGAISIDVTGGVAPFSYSWKDGPTTQNRTSLVAGTYSLTITDANGSKKYVGYSVTQPAAALALTENHTNILCSYNASVGAINLNVSGGTTAYTYAWTKSWNGSFSASTQNLSSLDSGTYNITVTDAKSCQATKAIMITKPIAISLSSANSNLTCNASNDGSATVSISGGTGAYTYAWVGPSSFTATTKNITSLVAGTYTLTATDANSCTSNLPVTITQPAAISVAATLTNVNCFGQSTGAATIVVTGGTAGYTYAWTDGPALSSRTGLAAGNYSLTVTDANSCKKVTSIPITQPTAAISVSATQVDVLCSEIASGSISLTVTGGTGTPSYAWTKAGSGTFSATTKNLSNLDNGNYNVIITDANACTESKAIDITKPSLLSVTTSISQPTCPPLLDGTISLTVSGGTSGYTYNWGGGILTQNRTAIGPGTYSVIVTDAHGCTNTISPILTYQNPSPITPSNIKH